MKKTSKGHLSNVMRIMIGVLTAFASLMGLICIFAVMVLNETLQESAITFSLVLSVGISVFVGCLIASANAESGKGKIALAVSGGVILILFALHFLLFPGKIYRAFSPICATICGGLLALWMVSRKKKGGYKQIKKYRFG